MNSEQLRNSLLDFQNRVDDSVPSADPDRWIDEVKKTFDILHENYIEYGKHIHKQLNDDKVECLEPAAIQSRIQEFEKAEAIVVEFLALLQTNIAAFSVMRSNDEARLEDDIDSENEPQRLELVTQAMELVIAIQALEELINTWNGNTSAGAASAAAEMPKLDTL